MTIGSTRVAHPVAAALARIDDAITQAREAVWSLGEDDLLDALDECERQAARLAGLGVELVRVADVRGVASMLGAPSTAALLRQRLSLHPGEAGARVRLAQILTLGPLEPRWQRDA
jgi:hypothetical protein